MVEFDRPSAIRVGNATKKIERLTLPADTPFDSLPLYQVELLEDAAGPEIVVQVFTVDGDTLVEEEAILTNKWDVLAEATAGYQCDAVYYEGRYYITHGPCIQACKSDATLTIPPSPQEETEGQPITPFSVTATGTIETDSLEVTGLPPGLVQSPVSQTQIDVSGIPTEAGTFFIKATVESPELDDDLNPTGAICTLTRILVMNVLEAP